MFAAEVEKQIPFGMYVWPRNTSASISRRQAKNQTEVDLMYMQSNKIHNVVLMSKFIQHLY